MGVYILFKPKWRSRLDPSTKEEAGGWDYPILSNGNFLGWYERNNSPSDKELLVQLDIPQEEADTLLGGEFQGEQYSDQEAETLLQDWGFEITE